MEEEKIKFDGQTEPEEEKVKLKSNWSYKDLQILGKELLEWMKADPENNFLLVEFFTNKDIQMDWLDTWMDETNRKYPRTFQKAYKLACQIQETRLPKKAVSKQYATAGVLAVLRNLCSWTSENPEIQTNINVTPENLEKIKNKYFKKSSKVTGVSEDGDLVVEDQEYDHKASVEETKKILAEKPVKPTIIVDLKPNDIFTES